MKPLELATEQRCHSEIESAFKAPFDKPIAGDQMAKMRQVAKLSEVPAGTSRTVRVEGHVIALHNVGDQIYGTRDQCPHEGVSLGTGGELEGQTITCGYHFWSFNVVTGRSEDGMDEEIGCYPVHVEGESIFVILPTADSAPECQEV